MQVRNPKIAFEEALPHWAPNIAFAQIVNAGSLTIPSVEIYLNKVMGRALAVLSDPDLKSDIEIFIGQEGHHYRQHRMFNKVMYARYPGLDKFDAELTAYYDEMLKNGSLLYNAAYCEGFESLGLIQAEFFFEHVADMLEGADARVVSLWRWHLAEEFEHRTVCYDVLYALGSSYFTRVRGFLNAMRHLGEQGKRVSDFLLDADHARMPENGGLQLAKLEKAYRRRLFWFSLPRVLAILSPTYDPRKKRLPRGASEILHQITPSRRTFTPG